MPALIYVIKLINEKTTQRLLKQFESWTCL